MSPLSQEFYLNLYLRNKYDEKNRSTISHQVLIHTWKELYGNYSYDAKAYLRRVYVQNTY